MLRLEMLLASVLPAPPGLRRAALDEPVDAPRLRHEGDLERPRDQRPIAEEPGPAGVSPRSNAGDDQTVALVARKAAVATLVVIGIVALTLALWKLRVLLSLFFLGLVIAAAMRPGIEWLHSRRVPRGVGLA